MDHYGDEGFIRLWRIRQEEVRNQDILKGSVRVNGDEFVFAEREIVRKRLWMWMPDCFKKMPQELAQWKYPDENRPAVIYTNTETTVNISFTHHQEEKLEAGEEEAYRDRMEQSMLQSFPASGTIEKDTVMAKTMPLAWFDFLTPAMDGEIYNLMFYASLDGRLLAGAFNCLSGDREDWKDCFMQMLATVRSNADGKEKILKKEC